MSEKVTKTIQNIDNYFNDVNLYRKAIVHDDSCLFRAVSEKLFFTQCHHERVKATCLDYMERHEADYQPFMLESMTDIIKQLKSQKRSAGHLEMIILSRIYRMDFFIYHPSTFEQFNMTQNMFQNKIHLCYAGNGHYDLVYSKDFQQSVAICQSLLYEVLYHSVFGFEAESEEAVVFLHVKKYRECSVADVIASLGKEKLPVLERLSGRTFPPLPYRVAKALHPCIYRNVELDIIHEELREAKSSKQSYFDNFAVGDKCQVYVDDEDSPPYHGHIQELDTDAGLCVVYIEELAIKKSLPARCIAPLPVRPANQGNSNEWPVAEIDLVRFQKRGRRRKTSSVPVVFDQQNSSHFHQTFDRSQLLSSLQSPPRPPDTPSPPPAVAYPYILSSRHSSIHQHSITLALHDPSVCPTSSPPSNTIIPFINAAAPSVDNSTLFSERLDNILYLSNNDIRPHPSSYDTSYSSQDCLVDGTFSERLNNILYLSDDCRLHSVYDNNNTSSSQDCLVDASYGHNQAFQQQQPDSHHFPVDHNNVIASCLPSSPQSQPPALANSVDALWNCNATSVGPPQVLLEDSSGSGVVVGISPAFPPHSPDTMANHLHHQHQHHHQQQQQAQSMYYVALPYGASMNSMGQVNVAWESATADDNSPLRFVPNTGLEYYRMSQAVNSPVTPGGYSTVPGPAMYHVSPTHNALTGTDTQGHHHHQYCGISVPVYGSSHHPSMQSLQTSSSSSSSSSTVTTGGGYNTVPVMAPTTRGGLSGETSSNTCSSGSSSSSDNNNVTSSSSYNSVSSSSSSSSSHGSGSGKPESSEEGGAKGDKRMKCDNNNSSSSSSSSIRSSTSIHDTTDDAINNNSNSNSKSPKDCVSGTATTTTTTILVTGGLGEKAGVCGVGGLKEKQQQKKSSGNKNNGMEDDGVSDSGGEHMDVGSDGDSGCCPSECTDLSPVSVAPDNHEFVDSTTGIVDNNNNPSAGVEAGTMEMSTKPRGKRRYYMYGNHKLIKPIKEIPHRFQTLLSETRAAKARCEGQPIYMQHSAAVTLQAPPPPHPSSLPPQPCDFVYYQTSDDLQQQQQQQAAVLAAANAHVTQQQLQQQPLNANANCFIPGGHQGNETTTAAALTFVTDDNMTMCPLTTDYGMSGGGTHNPSQLFVPPPGPTPMGGGAPSSQACPTIIVYSNNTSSSASSISSSSYLPAQTSMIYSRPSPTQQIQSIPMPPPPFPPPPSIPPPLVDNLSSSSSSLPLYHPPPMSTLHKPVVMPPPPAPLLSQESKPKPTKPLSLSLTNPTSVTLPASNPNVYQSYGPCKPTPHNVVQSPMSIDGSTPPQTTFLTPTHHHHHHHPTTTNHASYGGAPSSPQNGGTRSGAPTSQQYMYVYPSTPTGGAANSSPQGPVMYMVTPPSFPSQTFQQQAGLVVPSVAAQ